MAGLALVKQMEMIADPSLLARLQDFQVGWFWNIILKLCFAPGHRVRFDANFWTLTGARTKSYWDSNSGLVVAAFKVEVIHGEKWLYHSGLIRSIEASKLALEEVENKAHGHVCLETNDSLGELFISSYKNYPRHLQKRTAKKKFLEAVKRVSREQKITLLDAAEFISQRVIQYAAACEGARKEKKYIPYMSTWLNGDGFMDDPSEWHVQAELGGNSAKPQGNRAGSNGKVTGAYRGTTERDEREPDIIVS